jgi:hypothetical protein
VCISAPTRSGVWRWLVGLLELAGWNVAELAVDAGGVEPVDVLGHRELGLGAGAPEDVELDELVLNARRQGVRR